MPRAISYHDILPTYTELFPSFYRASDFKCRSEMSRTLAIEARIDFLGRQGLRQAQDVPRYHMRCSAVAR